MTTHDKVNLRESLLDSDKLEHDRGKLFLLFDKESSPHDCNNGDESQNDALSYTKMLPTLPVRAALPLGAIFST